jgi:DMSO reductase anchor subunit
VHPAGSIIVFTTLSGMGLGLIALLSVGALPPGSGGFVAGALLALALTGGGLLSSLLHLGHPERAWRALSQWRSSWLSREGVLAIATLAVFATLSSAVVLLDRWLWPVGVVCSVLAIATVYATAMIYGSLRAVPTWFHPLTPASYLAFSGAGGALLAALLARIAGGPGAALEALALVLLVAAWGIKLLWWRRALSSGFGPSTPETATGLGALGRVRLFQPPHEGPNYLTREMIHRVGRRHAVRLRRIALVAGAAVPIATVALSLAAGGLWPLLLVGALAHVLGLLAERWLFFAEAKHVVGLYYGEAVAR